MGNAQLSAQEESHESLSVNSSRYIDLRVKSLKKYNARIERQQNLLLKKLRRKETRFAKKLKRKDSVAYVRYQEQGPTFDSIYKVSKNDSSVVAKSKKKKNAALDTLRKIQSFAESKTGLPANVGKGASQKQEIGKLQDKLDKRDQINDLTNQRANKLKSISGTKGKSFRSKGIEKQLFYGKSKMNVFKEIEAEPTKAEDKALEYLQGTEGFEQHMAKAESGALDTKSLTSGLGADDLEKMGFQTRKKTQSALEKKFGTDLSFLGKNAASGLKQWDDISKKTDGLKNAKKGATSAKSSLLKLKNTQKPIFKVNPMRGLPFVKRIEKQFSWQATLASTDGRRPAIVEPSMMVGFKHTPKLTYGVGVSTAIGLGQNWSHIKFSFQGVGLRSFATWTWMYGIGAYAGYERTYKTLTPNKKTASDMEAISSPHNNALYSESLLIGLKKSYNITPKYTGAIQLLYDVWWQQKGLQSPFIIRFSTSKN